MTPTQRRRGSHSGRRWFAAALAVVIVAAVAAALALPGIGDTHTRSAAPSVDASASASPLAAAVAQAAGTGPAYTATTIQSGAFTTGIAEPAFLRYQRDDAGHVSYEVGTLKVKPPTRLPVYLIGGSNVREMIQTPADLQTALLSTSGVNTKVVDFGSTNQNFGETMAVVNNLPKGRGVVVISVNHTRFAYTPANATAEIQGTTLLMRSPALWQFITDTRGTAPADTIAPGVTFYRSDWRRRNAVALAAGQKPWNVYLPHRYFAGHLWSNAKKRSRVTLWLDGRGAAGAQFDRYHGFNGKLLQAIATLAVSRGYSVVLMEASSDLPIIGTAFDRYKAVYVPVCQTIAAGVNGLYVDLNTSTGLVNSDFHDLTHLVEPGRVKWTTGLAKALAPVAQAAASPSPTTSPTVSTTP